MALADPPFDMLGGAEPPSPILLSVPHGGRIYPDAMRASLRLAPARLVTLEDRHVDTLVRQARRGEWTLLARHGRAWIDLNRGEDERDPVLEGQASRGGGAMSAKVRSGLGLVPRRVPPGEDIWAGKLSATDVEARIAADHRPWHGLVADALDRARRRFGIAVLVDIHSMPPLPGGGQVVIGDRFGRSAAARFGARIEAVARGARLEVALNTPYPGGYTVERHGRPRDGIHAIQIEVDRALYLDAALDAPGAGFNRTAGWLGAVLTALADEALPTALAAE